MCTGFEIAALALAGTSTAATLYGQDTQAKQAQANAKFEAAQAEADARAEAGAAEIEAKRIRDAAKKQRGQAIAAAAASGVDVNSPTALKIDEQITASAEEDAVLTILGGRDRSARLGQQAAASRIAGSNARTAGRVAQASTLLSAASSAYGSGGNWKRASNASSKPAVKTVGNKKGGG